MPPKKRVRTVETTSLNADEVSSYLNAAYAAFTTFYKQIHVNSVVSNLVAQSSSFELVENPSEALGRWRGTRSVSYCLPVAEPKDLAHLAKEKPIRPKPMPCVGDEPKKTENIKFLSSSLFQYYCGIKTNAVLKGMNVRSYVESLKNGESATLEESKTAKGTGIAMFCGGPISSLAICPRADNSGKEVLAVSTFPHEVTLFLPDSPSSYVQLWSFDSSLELNADCDILLEIPNCTVLSMAWCPVLVNHPDKCFKTRLSRGQKSSNDGLGLLAVATDKGVVFIYSIPRYLSEMRDPHGNPSAFRTLPVATLVQTVDKDVKPSAIATLKWSAYNGGNRLVAISDEGKVLVWDLEKGSEQYKDPKGLLPHMRGIKRVHCPVTSFNSTNWDSPPHDVAWVDENVLVVSLRSRSIYLYSWPDLEEILSESKNRSIGLILLQTPELYDGFFCFDTALTNIDAISYTGSNYFEVEENNTVESISIANRHQIQISDAAISARSGIVSTVGMDGRLVQSLNGRILIKSDEETEQNFDYGRPILQLVRLRKEFGKENESPVVQKHEECLQNSWLEVRAGDAALLDLNTNRKHVHSVPEFILDRRLDALTQIAASKISDGLVATGGEAGFVFLLPTLL
ncbi:hypothetical protein M3Y97_00469200 [Aphelenchoides bicaudatus]|nr:hypothetical protein M3Y97_00469200 [Aphelenchoides bicaudatus]